MQKRSAVPLIFLNMLMYGGRFFEFRGDQRNENGFYSTSINFRKDRVA